MIRSFTRTPFSEATYANAFLPGTQVGSEIYSVTNEMKIIADGLGSGVTPKQIETSVELGRSWCRFHKTFFPSNLRPWRHNLRPMLQIFVSRKLGLF
jgi:hypothetical protein